MSSSTCGFPGYSGAEIARGVGRPCSTLSRACKHHADPPGRCYCGIARIWANGSTGTASNCRRVNFHHARSVTETLCLYHLSPWSDARLPVEQGAAEVRPPDSLTTSSKS